MVVIFSVIKNVVQGVSTSNFSLVLFHVKVKSEHAYCIGVVYKNESLNPLDNFFNTLDILVPKRLLPKLQPYFLSMQNYSNQTQRKDITEQNDNSTAALDLYCSEPNIYKTCTNVG